MSDCHLKEPRTICVICVICVPLVHYALYAIHDVVSGEVHQETYMFIKKP